MKSFLTLVLVTLSTVMCLVCLVEAGGDKSARTTVITLAGGGDKSSGGYPIPIPVPVCTGKMHYGGHHGGHHGGGYGAQARMGWRR